MRLHGSTTVRPHKAALQGLYAWATHRTSKKDKEMFKISIHTLVNTYTDQMTPTQNHMTYTHVHLIKSISPPKFPNPIINNLILKSQSVMICASFHI